MWRSAQTLYGRILYGRELSGMADGKGRRRNRGGQPHGRGLLRLDGARAARGREGERWREHFLLPEQQKTLEVRW